MYFKIGGFDKKPVFQTYEIQVYGKLWFFFLLNYLQALEGHFIRIIFLVEL